MKSSMKQFRDQAEGDVMVSKHGKSSKYGKLMGTDSISAISDINAGDNDVSITVVSGKPYDIEYLQENPPTSCESEEDPMIIERYANATRKVLKRLRRERKASLR